MMGIDVVAEAVRKLAACATVEMQREKEGGGGVLKSEALEWVKDRKQENLFMNNIFGG